MFSVESCDNLSYVWYKVVTQDGLGLCSPSLNDLQYIMQLHNQHNTTKNKNTNTMFSPTAGFQRLYFIGECDCRVLRNRSQSTQHSNVIFIDETNIFFILLTIILQVLDRHTHELKVSYFSDYLLFFLTNASKQCALTVFIHQYFNLHCPLSPGHVSA